MTYSHMVHIPKDKTQADDPSDEGSPLEERRRAAKIVHDERGNARVEWTDASKGSDRPLLSLDEPEASVHRGYDPYQRAPRTPRGGVAAPRRDRAPRRDLRKLSEWIKQMRALEERKRRDDD
ncbi:MAG TPA: hypothetical protein VME21_07760 [Steroidobacteraceae bacterium]|nr:hypothetical protein [Steroidobacteraceae bacterium]